MWKTPARATSALALLFLACGTLVFALDMGTGTRSADFLITTPDGLPGTLSLDRSHMHWTTDKGAAKIMGKARGDWVVLNGKITLINGSSTYALIEKCDWDSLGEGDKGDIYIDSEGHPYSSPAFPFAENWPKNTITAHWKCTFAN